ncbi:MAG: hypothetical protein L6R37_004355 [Teloschistes peruensis]|nr:MAG: hypothetical protein L6R37_004355 [Teloschistes peruensis]
MSSLQHTRPEDNIRQSLSPQIPSVLAFTPIDPRLLSIVPFESSSTSIPTANGVNSGKKRSRKLWAASPTASTLNPSKKARHTLAPRDDENVADQSTKLGPLKGSMVRKEHPKGFEAVVSPQPIQSEVSSKCKTLVKSSPSTFQQSSSTSTEGLSLAYQTAFRQGEQSRNTGNHAKLPSPDHEADQGIIPDLHLPYATVIEPSKGLPALERFWPNPYSGVRQVGTSHSKDFYSNIYKGKELQKDVETGSLSHDEARLFATPNSNVDFQAFDEFLVSDFELDSCQSEVQRANESATMADQKSSAADGLHLSYSSDIDLLMAENLSLSSSPSLTESSSPYLHSLADLPSTSVRAESSIAHFTANAALTVDEDIYGDDSLEMDLLDLQLPPSAQRPPPSPPCSPSSRRVTASKWVPPSPITPDASPTKSTMAKPSQASTDVAHQITFNRNTGAAIPFVRPPFPQGVRDRSPVIGITSSIRLRTCFRIGEAIRSCTNAFNTGQDVIIELYARITSSERLPGSVKQTFSFADIFSPAKGPYLSGTYNLWKGNGLWDADSKVLLGKAGQGKFARVLGKIVREEIGSGLQMKVLSIWEANWEDVAMCKGHVFSA